MKDVLTARPQRHAGIRPTTLYATPAGKAKHVTRHARYATDTTGTARNASTCRSCRQPSSARRSSATRTDAAQARATKQCPYRRARAPFIAARPETMKAPAVDVGCGPRSGAATREQYV